MLTRSGRPVAARRHARSRRCYQEVFMDTIVQDRSEQLREEFKQRLGGPNSIDTADSLCRGLTTLRKLLLTRLHNDVEAQFGIDTLRAPSTKEEARREVHNAGTEIEAYSA